MSRQRQRGFASSLVLMSVLVALMSLGGSWGLAYGQSAGEAPTPETGAGAAEGVGGAEGVALPSRQEAVAGEEGGRQEAVAGEEGQATGPAQLDQTGADSSLQWTLVYIGIVLFAAGALIFVRTRRTL